MAANNLFTTFNFLVQLSETTKKKEKAEGDAGGEDKKPGKKKFLCEAQFSECNGLEMGMATKTIKEGGNNIQQIHLAGPVTYGQLTLKRGMTKDFGLWDWFEKVQENRRLRLSGDIFMMSSNRRIEDKNRKDVHFEIRGCLPMKIKAPSLSGKDGQIAIEEMQIAYESLFKATPKKPEEQ